MRFRRARRWLVLLPLIVVCAGGIPTNRYQIAAGAGRDGKYLQIDNGRLALGKTSVGDGTDNRDALDCWYVAGGKIKNSLTGAYLAYDPTGKSPQLFVVEKPGEGTDWRVTLKKRSPGDEERGSLQATEGTAKDWYVIVDEGQARLSAESVHPVEVRRVYIHK